MEKKTWDDMTEKERWEYVNQDYVGLKEKVWDHIFIENTKQTDWPEANFDNPKILKNIIIGLHNEGKTTHEIGYHVPCNLRYIRRVIQEWKGGTEKT